ncbi:MAG: metal ABC transporter ATP-binding protein [Bacteroidota bacterium]
MSSPIIIKVEGLSVSYERKRVLTNIYLDIAAGGIYGVIGPNGAGKSTLFKAMLGLVETSVGKVRFWDKPIADSRKAVAYIPQKNDVDWNFPATVFDVVEMGRYPHKKLLQRLGTQDKELVKAALREVGMEELAQRQIGELSGGQQQRVFIARALCQEADILFLDEPFVGVDMKTEERIIDILKRLAQQGKTLLVVHHDLSTVNAYFDKVILLNQRLIAAGDTDTIFTEQNINATYSSQLPILHKTGGL